MVTNHFWRRFSALLVAGFLSGFIFAQDGDAFGSYLGKTAEDPGIKKLEKDYKCEMANEAHCLSKEGLELIFKEGKLNEINIYKNSTVYGSFPGKLPHGVAFDMTPTEVIKLLGKPTLEYNNSGYSEFNMNGYTIACWYEGGHLKQVGLTAKTG